MNTASMRSRFFRSRPVALLLAVVVLIVPFPASAQTGILPACALGDGGCGICDMVSLLGNVSTFLLDIVSVVVVLAIIIGGLFWLLSFGNAERIDRGKQIITAAFIGLGFVLGGFVLVNVVIATLTNTDSGEIVRPFGNTEWNKICTDKNPAGEVEEVSSTVTETNCDFIQRAGESCAEATCNDINACVCVQGATSQEWGCISRCAYTAQNTLLTLERPFTGSCLDSADTCRTQVSGIFQSDPSTRVPGSPGSPGGSAPYTCSGQEVCCIVPAGSLQGMVPEYNF